MCVVYTVQYVSLNVQNIVQISLAYKFVLFRYWNELFERVKLKADRQSALHTLLPDNFTFGRIKLIAVHLNECACAIKCVTNYY